MLFIGQQLNQAIYSTIVRAVERVDLNNAEHDYYNLDGGYYNDYADYYI